MTVAPQVGVVNWRQLLGDDRAFNAKSSPSGSTPSGAAISIDADLLQRASAGTEGHTCQPGGLAILLADDRCLGRPVCTKDVGTVSNRNSTAQKADPSFDSDPWSTPTTRDGAGKRLTNTPGAEVSKVTADNKRSRSDLTDNTDVGGATIITAQTVEKIAGFLLLKPDQLPQRKQLLRTCAQQGRTIANVIKLEASDVEKAIRLVEERLKEAEATAEVTARGKCISGAAESTPVGGVGCAGQDFKQAVDEQLVRRLTLYLQQKEDSAKAMAVIRSPASGVPATAAEAAIARAFAESVPAGEHFQ